MTDRRFFPGEVNHCYQRTADHGVLFYSVSDHLMFFTIYCMVALRHHVKVLKLVQMPNHIHHSVIAGSVGQLSAFCRDVASIFAREYNRSHGLTGPVFERPFGSAPKRGKKAIRSHLIYLDNNPVERKLTDRPQAYRWNYLGFAESDHPFSEKILLRKASMPMRRALSRLQSLHRDNQYLTYPVLQGLFKSLPEDREREQLTDYIINLYSIIDHRSATQFFGGFKNEIQAAQSVSGNEYDLKESFVGKSDSCYAMFTSLLLKTGRFKDIHQILLLPEPEKRALFQYLHENTLVQPRQIASYLHLPVEINF